MSKAMEEEPEIEDQKKNLTEDIMRQREQTKQQ